MKKLSFGDFSAWYGGLRKYIELLCIVTNGMVIRTHHTVAKNMLFTKAASNFYAYRWPKTEAIPCAGGSGVRLRHTI